jgi:hypothetical protein
VFGSVVRHYFVDIGDASRFATPRVHLAARAIHHDLSEIDAATIRLDAPRRFTQEVSRLVYEWHEDHGGCAGICYRSRLGDQFANWAIFEPPPDTGLDLPVASSREIATDDPDLLEALRLLNLELGCLPRAVGAVLRRVRGKRRTARADEPESSPSGR